MPIRICEYSESMIPAVRAFNERLRQGGRELQFSESDRPAWLPKIAGRKLFQEFFLAVDDEAAVRGGYILKHQSFVVRGVETPLADYRMPISEAIVNRAYPQVAVQMLRDAMQRQPLLFGMGMGGPDEPVARLFAAAGWTTFAIPFFFSIVHPTSFLKNIATLRSRTVRRIVADMMAATGLGWLGIRTLQALRGRTRRPPSTIAAEPVEEFSDWADELWNRCKTRYGMSAVRDAETLRILYPRNDARFIRLHVVDRSRTLGWAVLLDTQCAAHKYFGNMRLGSIVDCLADPDDATAVAVAAKNHLIARGVDLIVSNQSHTAWVRGLQKAGFWQGPSNYLFTSAPKLTELLRRNGVANADMHLNRGDGDGPINL